MSDPVETRWEPDRELLSYFGGQAPVRLERAAAAWPHVRMPASGAASGAASPAGPAPVDPLFLRRPERMPVTFLRAFELPFGAAVAALDSWWQSESGSGWLEVGRSRLLGPPRNTQPARCQMGVRLCRGFGWRALAMEFELVPWYQSFGTIIGVCPVSRARPGRVYFRSGNALVDGIVASLDRHAAKL